MNFAINPILYEIYQEKMSKQQYSYFTNKREENLNSDTDLLQYLKQGCSHRCTERNPYRTLIQTPISSVMAH